MCCGVMLLLLITYIYIYVYIYIHMLHIHMFVTLKKVYDRNVVNKYGLYSLLGVMIYNLIDYIYIDIYIYTGWAKSMVTLRHFTFIRHFDNYIHSLI